MSDQNIYKVELFIKGTEDDAIALRKDLAQVVYDEFELGSVFGVSVTPDPCCDDIMNRV